jgi:hypothetical protein
MSSASQLNDKQLEAMKYVQGPLLVLAGAGSGKTSVITRKVAFLVQQCGIPAHRITAMTFTNKAAREMKERVAKSNEGKEIADDMIKGYDNLTNKISDTKMIIDNVTRFSREQETGIVQINDTISRLDRATQENAMTASNIDILSKEVSKLFFLIRSLKPYSLQYNSTTLSSSVRTVKYLILTGIFSFKLTDTLI